MATVIDMTNRDNRNAVILLTAKHRLNLEMTGLTFKVPTLATLKRNGNLPPYIRRKKHAIAVIDQMLEGINKGRLCRRV